MSSILILLSLPQDSIWENSLSSSSARLLASSALVSCFQLKKDSYVASTFSLRLVKLISFCCGRSSPSLSRWVMASLNAASDVSTFFLPCVELSVSGFFSQCFSVRLLCACRGVTANLTLSIARLRAEPCGIFTANITGCVSVFSMPMLLLE